MELGANCYVVGDVVEFKTSTQLLIGTIVVSDYGGALGYSSNTYDISTQRVLYKHVEENLIVRIIKKVDRLSYQKKYIEWFLDFLEKTEKNDIEKFKKDKSQKVFKLNENSELGKYLFFTQSGSEYVIYLNGNGIFMSRENEQHRLRKDSQSIRVLFLDVRIGLPAFFILEPLGKGDYTIRQTTRIIEIKKINS
ncbi:hypothetical protein [Liquorilactobacillus nagelii]|uniref:hypothetical protein n=1 Tax=Liquorilactobacillus nagelii TaxID=82688 RepID=UPI0039EC2378